MREFLVTPEMKAAANADRQEMMRLRDEMERAGFLFKAADSFDLAEPHQIDNRLDGTAVFRQWHPS